MLRRALTIALATVLIGSTGTAAAATRFERGLETVSAQRDLIALVNVHRANNELRPVSRNGWLTAAATWMAGGMAARRRSACPPFGYAASSMYTGEDLGAGYGTAGALLAGWQASAAHNAVLLNPNYDAVGIGLVYDPSSAYKWYWAADFGGPGARAPSTTIPDKGE